MQWVTVCWLWDWVQNINLYGNSSFRLLSIWCHTTECTLFTFSTLKHIFPLLIMIKCSKINTFYHELSCVVHTPSGPFVISPPLYSAVAHNMYTNNKFAVTQSDKYICIYSTKAHATLTWTPMWINTNMTMQAYVLLYTDVCIYAAM